MPDNPNSLTPLPPDGQLLIYENGASRLQVRLDGQTVWLSQRLIAELFQVSVPTVNEHLAGIYGDGELDRRATIRKFRIVQREGARDVTRDVDHYNLDAFLHFNERDILTHAGSVSHALAERHAHAEFEKHESERRRLEAAQPTSDFDHAVEEVKRLETGDMRKSAPKKAGRKRKPKLGEE